MRRFAPLLTLLAVAVLGGALLTLNVVNSPANSTGTPSAAAPSQPAVAAAPPATSAPPATAAVVEEKAYAGRSAGNEVTVAIAVKDGRAVGYVCDGKKIEAWLEGTLSGSDLALKSKDGKSTIAATADDKQSFGTVAVSGKEWPFAAKAASSPAGLYEGRAQVRGVLNRIGWIQLQDGSQTGVWNRGADKVAAPVLDPARPDAVVVDGVPVTVRTIGGADVVIAP
ncbi:MAG TPA: hypothetical protein VJT79_13860 [Pseudonocardia sp.]|nr:hypothetical protein [Pseudonocardia sp.]